MTWIIFYGKELHSRTPEPHLRRQCRLPDIDEVKMMREAVTELQSVTSLPLQIDTVNIEAMETAMRYYNGKPMVNSVNGKQESMDAVFPLIQKVRRCSGSVDA